MLFRMFLIMCACYVPTAMAALQTLPVTATMDAHDALHWQQSDGWKNGVPFQVGWRADHLSFASSILSLKLDNQPACAVGLAACSNEPYAAGEYSSIDLISYGRVTFRAKPAAVSGVITGLFTYTGPSDGQPHDEIDIEFLGKDTTGVQFNYYTAGVGGNEIWIPLGFDAAQAFHDYTIEWLSTGINWYVDGVLKHTVYVATGVTLPSFPQHIFLNIWAAIGVNAWSGPFVYANTAITAQVDQVSYTPAVGLTTASSLVSSGGGCTIASGHRNTVDSTLWFMLVFLALNFAFKRFQVD